MKPWLQYAAGAVGGGLLILLLVYPREMMGLGLLLWLTRRGHRALRHTVHHEERGH